MENQNKKELEKQLNDSNKQIVNDSNELDELIKQFEEIIEEDDKEKKVEQKNLFEREEPKYVDVVEIETKFEHKKNQTEAYKQKAINWEELASAKLNPLEISEELRNEIQEKTQINMKKLNESVKKEIENSKNIESEQNSNSLGLISNYVQDHDYEGLVEMPLDSDYENKNSEDEWEIDPELLDDSLLKDLLIIPQPSKNKKRTSKKKEPSKSTRKTTTPKTNDTKSNLIGESKNRSRTAGVDFAGADSVIFISVDEVKQASWEDVVKRKGRFSYHMTPVNNGGWFIKRSGNSNPSAYVADKEQALELGKQYAEREKATLKVHNEKGIIIDSYSYGRVSK